MQSGPFETPRTRDGLHGGEGPHRAQLTISCFSRSKSRVFLGKAIFWRWAERGGASGEAWRRTAKAWRRSLRRRQFVVEMPLNLPTSEELVVEDAELRSILTKIAKRSAGGRAVSGRYNKHDTARLFIRSIALPGIRFGQLVPDDDMQMLCVSGR